jgi:hypothetical protein
MFRCNRSSTGVPIVCIRELLFGYSIAIAAGFFVTLLSLLQKYTCTAQLRQVISYIRVVSMVDVSVYSVSTYLMLLTVLLVFYGLVSGNLTSFHFVGASAHCLMVGHCGYSWHRFPCSFLY